MAWTGATATSVSLRWNAATDNVGVTGYRLYRNGTLVTTTTGLSYTFTGLSCGTSYTFALEAVDAAGNASNRAEASGTTSTTACVAAPTDGQAPASPTGMAWTGITPTSISVGWNAATDNVGVTGYRLYRDGVLATTTTALSHTFEGLTCGTRYTIAIEAIDAAGNASNRAEATGATSTQACVSAPADTQAPSVPQRLRATSKSRTSVSMRWDPATDNVGVTGYRLYRNGVVVGTTQQLSYTFTGLQCGTRYTFAVEALDAAGNASDRSRATSASSTSGC